MDKANDELTASLTSRCLFLVMPRRRLPQKLVSIFGERTYTIIVNFCASRKRVLIISKNKVQIISETWQDYYTCIRTLWLLVSIQKVFNKVFFYLFYRDYDEYETKNCNSRLFCTSFETFWHSLFFKARYCKSSLIAVNGARSRAARGVSHRVTRSMRYR